MGKVMCPGQDTAFWRPGDIYEVPCSQCGRELEFFKDDVSRRCTGCGSCVSQSRDGSGVDRYGACSQRRVDRLCPRHSDT